MDKRKYQSKKLIAEFEHYRKDDCWFDDADSKYIEKVYKLKDDSIIIEFDGGCFSIYGIAITFNKYIGRKGVFEISKADYKNWKKVRANDVHGELMDWENEMDEIIEMDREIILKCIGNEKMPF